MVSETDLFPLLASPFALMFLQTSGFYTVSMYFSIFISLGFYSDHLDICEVLVAMVLCSINAYAVIAY